MSAGGQVGRAVLQRPTFHPSVRVLFGEKALSLLPTTIGVDKGAPQKERSLPKPSCQPANFHDCWREGNYPLPRPKEKPPGSSGVKMRPARMWSHKCAKRRRRAEERRLSAAAGPSNCSAKAAFEGQAEQNKPNRTKLNEARKQASKQPTNQVRVITFRLGEE